MTTDARINKHLATKKLYAVIVLKDGKFDGEIGMALPRNRAAGRARRYNEFCSTPRRAVIRPLAIRVKKQTAVAK